MMALADALREVTAACDEEGHPLDLWRVLEPAYLKAADTVGRSAEPVQPDPEVVHPRGGESLRRRHPRRLWQGVRREQLRHLLEGAHAAGSLARSRATVRRRVPGSLHPVRAARHHARVPFGGRERCHRAGGPQGAARRRLAEHAGRVDRARRPDPFQDQAEWRQRRAGLRSHHARRPRRAYGDAGASCPRLALHAGFQRGLPGRGLPARRCCGASARRRPTGSRGSSTWSNRRRAISPAIAAT